MRGLLCMLPGQVVLSAFEVQGSQGAVGAGVRGVEAHRLLQRGEHRLILAILRVGHGEEVMGIGHLWSEFHQGTELPHGSSGVALLQVPEAQVVVRRHRPGVATHRRLELGKRPRQFAAFGV